MLVSFKRNGLYALLAALSMMMMSGCDLGRDVPLPTPADLDALATSLPLTQNPPPTPFDRPQTAFAQIDAGLTRLAGWRYVVQLDFDGVFARTPRETHARTQAEVWYNQLASARRVVVQTEGELIGQSENVQYEAVRLGPDAFLVRDGACLIAESDAALAADLRAGDLIGGVGLAAPSGRSAVINGETVWQYTFDAESLLVPSVRVEEGGYVVYESGELWIAPNADDNGNGAVVRYYVNLTVENAIIFDRQLPVSGTLVLRYDLYEVGTAVNISVPFGC
jgi:hypothetical protein